MCLEQVAVGDEISVVGRFQQHVGQVMSAVYQSLGMDIRMGDCKISILPQDTKVPDIVLVGPDASVRAVGEAKTPWMHSILDAMSGGDHLFRNMIGQIARYLDRASMKYGFLTTYDQTMFFKRDLHPLDSGRCILYFSNVIMYDANSRDTYPSSNIRDYHDAVTLRECFLFLAKRTADGHIVNAPRDPEWGAKKTKSFNKPSENYRDSSLPNPIAGLHNAPPVPGSQGRQPPTQMPVGRSRHEATLGPPATGYPTQGYGTSSLGSSAFHSPYDPLAARQTMPERGRYSSPYLNPESAAPYGQGYGDPVLNTGSESRRRSRSRGPSEAPTSSGPGGGKALDVGFDKDSGRYYVLDKGTGDDISKMDGIGEDNTS